MVEEINNERGFEEFIKKSKDKPVLIDFWAPWCMPCLMMAPILEDVSNKLKSKIFIAKVNVDENKELAEKFSIMSIPTLIVFKDGEEKERFLGSMPANVLEEKLSEFLS